MGVRAHDDQTGGDAVLAVRIQEIRDWHPASVREVAGRWEQGLRGLLGLAGVTGLVSAPLAVERLAGPTQVVVGVLLGVVLVASGAGLVLAMSAAYGSVRLVPAPGSHTEFQRLRWSLAERDRKRLVWGRRLAVGALLLFALAVTVAWFDPADGSTDLLQIETDTGVTYCGSVLDAAHGTVAVHVEGSGPIAIPVANVAGVDVVHGCTKIEP